MASHFCPEISLLFQVPRNCSGPFLNHSASNSFWLALWYNLGMSADYANNPCLSYNQCDKLDENTAMAQTFLCLWLQQIVVHRAGAQPRPLQALGRLSGGEEAHTPPSSSFHNTTLNWTLISAGCGLTHPSKCSKDCSGLSEGTCVHTNTWQWAHTYEQGKNHMTWLKTRTMEKQIKKRMT